MTHGGRRPGAGQPPKYGVRMTERVGLVMTEAERAEIEVAIPDGHPVGRWIVEAALARARSEAESHGDGGLTNLDTGRIVSSQ